MGRRMHSPASTVLRRTAPTPPFYPPLWWWSPSSGTWKATSRRHCRKSLHCLSVLTPSPKFQPPCGADSSHAHTRHQLSWCHPYTQLLTRKYWWPTLASDVCSYIQSCSLCTTTKNPHTPPSGKLLPLIVPGRLWSYLAVDFLP